MLDPKTILFLRYCWFKKNVEQKSVAGTNYPKKDANNSYKWPNQLQGPKTRRPTGSLQNQ